MDTAVLLLLEKKREERDQKKMFQFKWWLPREAAVFCCCCFAWGCSCDSYEDCMLRYRYISLLPFAKMLLSLDLNICLTYQ